MEIDQIDSEMCAVNFYQKRSKMKQTVKWLVDYTDTIRENFGMISGK